jgi:glutamyl/glutaminyl-tRNA synthetase
VVWGVASATGGRVVLRIEDHDRQRCRPEYEVALLDDLAALGFQPDEPAIPSLRTGTPSPYRQHDNGPAYAAALHRLDGQGLVYGCACSRATYATWAAAHGRRWSGPGCPGACRAHGLARDAPGISWRVSLGEGLEAWTDLALGPQVGAPSGTGDLPARDRHGNWTYGFCVVVDDLRDRIDLVIRGEDLLPATPAQVRLGRLLGRATPPSFLHHPLIRRPDGRKLSKADGATAVRELLAAGASAADLRARAAAAIGLAGGPADRVAG